MMASSNPACLLVGFSQDLSVMLHDFSLTINQHQPNLSAQKPTGDQTDPEYVGCVDILSHTHEKATWLCGSHTLMRDVQASTIGGERGGVANGP